MPLELEPLPYDAGALAPHLSAEAVGHHRRQQLGRIEAINALLADHPLADAPLDRLVREARGALAAHAAQAWNEAFYWAALKPPQDGGAPSGALAEAIDAHVGGITGLRERFDAAAAAIAGPGWAWLLRRRDGRLAVIATPGTTTPITGEDVPLLACCLWAHAWEIDHGEGMGRHFEAFWRLVDWKTVAARMRG